MANDYFFNGDDKEHFMKSSWQVYTNASGVLQYIGKTTNEKTISPGLEIVRWYDNTSGVQTLYVMDIDKAELKVSFGFMQVTEPDVLAMAMNLDYDNSDPDTSNLYFGSNPNPLQEFEWRFVGRSRSALVVTLILYSAICLINGDWATGAPGDYTNVPVTVEAMQDTSISNTQRDLGVFQIEKRTAS